MTEVSLVWENLNRNHFVWKSRKPDRKTLVKILKESKVQHEALKAVDTSVISVWKLMKYYSSVKPAVYSKAQIVKGLKKLKLLKAATTRCLSQGETTKHLISYFQSLIDSLGMMIMKDQKTETIGINNELLKPETILKLLLVGC